MIKFKCLHMYVCVVLYVFIKSLDFPKGTKNTDNMGKLEVLLTVQTVCLSVIFY